jgi:hypothetical protein
MNSLPETTQEILIAPRASPMQKHESEQTGEHTNATLIFLKCTRRRTAQARTPIDETNLLLFRSRSSSLLVHHRARC